jgi:capsular polysaccharide biosynthesis protein
MTSTKTRGNALSNLGFLAPALRLWPIILVATLGGGLATWGLSQTSTPVYTATSTLYFSLSNGTSATDLNQGSAYTQQQMLSFSQLAKSSSVLTPVVDKLGLDLTPTALANSVSVSTPQNTVVLDISASSTSPKRAADIANEVGVSLKDVVAEVAPTAIDGAPTVRIRTIERASTPTFASSPNTRVNTIAGLLIGFAASTLLVILLARLDNRLRRPSDVEEVTSLPILATFDRDRSHAGGHVAQAHPRTAEAESYRQVRAELENASLLRRPLNLLVTSATPGEGASTVARNLAAAFGRDGEPATVVEAREYVRPKPGASDQATVIDTPAVLQTADAAAIARDVDGIVLVVDRRQARAPQLRQAIQVLERSGGTIMGIVMTNTSAHPHPAPPARAGDATPPTPGVDDQPDAADDDSVSSSAPVASR